MKNKVRFFSLFFFIALLFVMVGCAPDAVEPTPIPTPDPTPMPTPTPTPDPVITDYNILGGWSDGGDGAYMITTNTAAELEFAYAKGTFPYAYMSSQTITEDLSVYKKLVITVEGSGTMLLKLETNDGTPAKEIGLNVTGIKGTYEWNLLAASDFLAKVDKVVIIAAPGKEESVGEISITELKFGLEVASGFIINDGFNNIPSNVNEYNGTDATFNFNDKWENFAEETYTITKVGPITQVAFTKDAGFEWSAMQSRVQGNFTNFNYVVVKVSGTAGQPIIVKAANNVETRVILNGEIQEVVVDLSDMALADKNAITSILIFGNAGRLGSGSFTIHEAFMINDYEFETPIVMTNTYNGTDKSFAVGYWFDGGDEVYSITEIGMEYFVEYNKLESFLHWANMQALLEGDFSSFSKLEFEITGQNAKSALLKVEGPQGNIELTANFDGTRQTFVIDLTTLTTAQLQALNKVVIFAAAGGIGAGEFTIHSVTFMTSDIDIQDGWVSLDAGVYTFAYGETTVVTYNKAAGQEWSAALLDFDLSAVEGLNTLTIVLKGTIDKSVLLKPNDSGALEQTVTFTTTDPVTVTVTADAFTKLVIFGEGGTAPATGSFEIVSIILSYVAPEIDFDPTAILDINSNWESLDTGTYTFTEELDGSVTVAYAHDAWKFFRQNFSAQEAEGLNTMTIVMAGTVGTKILIKPNDSNALEQWVTLTETVSVFHVIFDGGFTNIIMAADPEQASTGTFSILSATLSYSHNFNLGYQALDANTYTFTENMDGSVTVTYDHDAWKFFKNDFDLDYVTGLNTMIIEFTGEVGTKILVKPNDSGALEEWITLGAEPYIFTAYNANGFTNIIMAGDPEQASTGSFTIVSAILVYVDTVVMPEDPEWIGYGMTVLETETDVTITYTATPAEWWSNNAQLAVLGFDGTKTSIVFTFTGVLGHEYLFKIEGGGAAVELAIVADGTVQELILPLAGLTEAQRNNLSLIVLFVKTETAAGSVVINHWVYGPDVLPDDPEWVGFNMTVLETETEVTITYANTPAMWWNNNAQLQNFVFDGMNTSLVFTFTGVLGHEYLFKIEGGGAAVELAIIADGTEQDITLSLAGLTEEQRNNLNLIVIFVKTETAGGTLIIHGWAYGVEEMLDPTTVLDVNDSWMENDLGTYTFNEALDGSVTVNYDKTGWAFMKQTFDPTLTAGLNTLTIVFEGTVGKQILVKPNDSGLLEQMITFTENQYVLTVYSETGFANLLIFAEPNTTAAGSFTIVSATLSYSIDVNSSWVENDLGTYTFTEEVDGSVTVDYDKSGWAFMKQTFDPEMTAGMNTLTIVFEGTVGKQILVKPNDSGLLEQMIVFTEDSYVLTVYSLTGFANVLIFAEPDTLAAGSFTILSAMLSYVAPEDGFDPTVILDVNSSWMENDLGTYTFTEELDGSVTVNYDKSGWAFMKQTFDQDVVLGLNTITIVFEGTVGKQILVKPNDSGALEQMITFTADQYVFTAYSETGFANLLIFAEPDTLATGSFTIVSAELSYTVNVNSNWMENDLGTYTFIDELDGSVTVNYDKSGWAFMKQTFDQEVVSGMNTLTIVFEGTVGKQILVKPNDNGALEQMITFTADHYVLTVYSATGFANLLIFAEPDTIAAGSFTIISAVLSHTPQE